MSLPSQFSDVPADVWCAVAGTSASRIPSVDSYVYYFPQGHLEHSDLKLDSALPSSPILCRVHSVRFLCSHVSDQAFVKFVLVRVANPNKRQLAGDEVINDENINSDVAVFAKVLTPSDANNGGGFSVPRFCADSIFPPLDYAADPPVQTLKMLDVVSGNADWEFRHIYRGTPRRHLLTTGWGKFVNGKKLVAGDSVVFMRRKSTSELIIGIRREKSGWRDDERNVNTNVGSNEVVVNGVAGFEVAYFPRSGVPEFVVSAELVDKAMAKGWFVGMKVKMPVEDDDSSRTTWFSGTIEEVRPSVPGSPWRMLKVIWDEPQLLANTENVSPWQVKCAMPHEEGLHVFPPHKMLKGSPMLLNGCEQPPEFALLHKNNYMTRWTSTGTPGFSNYNTAPLLPTSIQGARLARSQSTYNTIPWSENFHQSFTELLTSGLEPESGPSTGISTVLNLGSSSHDHTLSPPSQCSVHTFGASSHEPSALVVESSIQLFGKTIHFEITKNVGGMDAAYYKWV